MYILNASYQDRKDRNIVWRDRKVKNFLWEKVENVVISCEKIVIDCDFNFFIQHCKTY